MTLGGITPLSLQDYPGRAAIVLYTQGCNLRCPWCHNPELVLPHRFGSPLPRNDVLHLLRRRRRFLQAVVISGGEPTMHAGLEVFTRELKELGYTVKLDSNGCRPHVLEQLMKQELIDYLALDYKLPLPMYHMLGQDVPTERVEASLRLAHTWPRDKRMIRTTVVPRLHTFRLLAEMEEELHQLSGGAPLHWVKQPFRAGSCLDRAYNALTASG
ncbi:MAG: anaerobic ribonucleoside-triphosphate reductase activating protein [Limnochordia bacterium]